MREPTMMAAVVSPLFAYGISLGIPAREIELRTGVSRADLVVPDNRIPEVKLARLWQQVEDACPDRAMVIDYVKSAPLASIAGLAYSARYASTIRQVFDLVIRNQAFASEGCSLELVEQSDEAIFLASSVLGEQMRHAVICLLGICWRSLNEVLEIETEVKRVEIVGRPSGSPSEYENFFGAPVQFHSQNCALVIDRVVLDLPSKFRNDDLRDFTEAFFEINLKRRELEEESSDYSRLLGAIAKNVSGGEFSASAIADDAGISLRTAQRIAAKRSTTLGDLIREARFSRIEQLLLDDKISLVELAYLSGYSDDRAFRRAFKSKFGMPPSDYREKVLDRLAN